MRRALLAAAALAAALAACPLPQPLPDYPAGTITPPRILADEIDGRNSAVILVPADCPTAPEYPLSAQILDTNSLEQVEARWFVNYDSRFATYYHPSHEDTVPPDPDPLVLTRTVPPLPPVGQGPWNFRPYDYPPPADPPTPGFPPYQSAGVVRVVELVVSNGFDPTATDPPEPLPMRTPLAGFETQVYRWVFLTVPETAGACDPTDRGCVKCP